MNYLIADLKDLNALKDSIDNKIIHVRRSENIKLTYKVLSFFFLLIAFVCLFIQYPQDESQSYKLLMQHNAIWIFKAVTSLFWLYVASMSFQLTNDHEFYLDLAERKYQFRKRFGCIGSWKTTNEGTNLDMV